jgi:hypothetical protein
MTLDVSYRAGADWKGVHVVIDSPDHVRTVLDRLSADDATDAVVIHRDRPRIGPRSIPDHQLLVGVRGDVGAILYSDDTGSWATVGDGPDAPPVYAEMEFPTYCEVPLHVIEKALAEFLATRARPTCVEWQRGE